MGVKKHRYDVCTSSLYLLNQPVYEEDVSGLPEALVKPQPDCWSACNVFSHQILIHFRDMIEVRVVDAFPDGLLRLRESMISSKKPIGKVKDQVIEVLLSSVIQIQGYLSIDLLVYSRQHDEFNLRLI